MRDSSCLGDLFFVSLFSSITQPHANTDRRYLEQMILLCIGGSAISKITFTFQRIVNVFVDLSIVLSKRKWLFLIIGQGK